MDSFIVCRIEQRGTLRSTAGFELLTIAKNIVKEHGILLVLNHVLNKWMRTCVKHTIIQGRVIVALYVVGSP